MTRSMPAAVLFLAMTASAFAASAPSTRPVIVENAASCDIGTYSAATLLLPYFEVDYKAPATSAIDTVFTVVNTSRLPQIARMTIWTDLGFPAAWCPIFLTGYGTMSVSMYNILARGNFPYSSSRFAPGEMSAGSNANPNFAEETWCELAGGTVSAALVQRLQKMLTTGERDTACRVGLRHEHAIGYVTIDVVNSCDTVSPTESEYWTTVLLYDNVLTGDYQRINPNTVTGNYAGGNPLVHLRAVPEGGRAGTSGTKVLPFTFYDRYTPAAARQLDRRQPLPTAFAARWINGGPTGFLTNYIVWREGLVGATREECSYAKNTSVPLRSTSVVRFDEHENAVVMQSCTDGCTTPALPVTSVISSSSGIFPPAGTTGDVGGWIWMSLDNHAGDGAAASPYSTTRASQNWVIVQMSAEGRYAVDFDATSLVNGCTPVQPAPP
jgi:hypothetical protein